MTSTNVGFWELRRALRTSGMGALPPSHQTYYGSISPIRLAVHARQLALEPHLRVLHRSPRPLLRRLEQAHQSAMDHHVHRPSSLGIPVLISGTRYNNILRS